jgi:hypothetical protein
MGTSGSDQNDSYGYSYETIHHGSSHTYQRQL